MQLYSLIYSSAESDEMSESQLVSLLNQARENNSKNNITGMLLYYKKSFLQVLEGDKIVINNLYQNKICLDKRHTAITKYFLYPIEQRTFPDWSMAFYAIQNEDIKLIQGYSEFLDRGFNSNLLKHEPTVAKQILLMFAGRIPPI